MGELMRRYWQPIAAVAELDDNPVKPVKLLGESLVLYRDRQGRLGLIGDTCPHRRTSMLYGVPEDEGLRCPYHGWMFNETGQCIEMPAEAPDSTFPSRVKMAGYPVQELCGLIFAYLGPEPVPLLPRWDMFVWDNVLRDIGSTIIPCNWLQIMENSLDPVHVEWLHGRFADYVLERLGRPELKRQFYRPGSELAVTVTAGRTRKSASTNFPMGLLNGAWSPAGPSRTRNGASGIRSCSRTSCAWAAISSIGCRWMTPTPCICGSRPIPSPLARRCHGRTRSRSTRCRCRRMSKGQAEWAVAGQ